MQNTGMCESTIAPLRWNGACGFCEIWTTTSTGTSTAGTYHTHSEYRFHTIQIGLRQYARVRVHVSMVWQTHQGRREFSFCVCCIPSMGRLNISLMDCWCSCCFATLVLQVASFLIIVSPMELWSGTGTLYTTIVVRVSRTFQRCATKSRTGDVEASEGFYFLVLFTECSEYVQIQEIRSDYRYYSHYLPNNSIASCWLDVWRNYYGSAKTIWTFVIDFNNLFCTWYLSSYFDLMTLLPYL